MLLHAYLVLFVLLVVVVAVDFIFHPIQYQITTSGTSKTIFHMQLTIAKLNFASWFLHFFLVRLGVHLLFAFAIVMYFWREHAHCTHHIAGKKLLHFYVIKCIEKVILVVAAAASIFIS